MNTTTEERPTYGPYSPIRETETLYFVSGQVGVDPDTKTAPSSSAEQTHLALQNMRRVLESNGLSLNNVVKTIIFVTDMGDFEAVNDVYKTYFDDPKPARSTVGVQELPRVGGGTTIKVEIEAIAAKNSQER